MTPHHYLDPVIDALPYSQVWPLYDCVASSSYMTGEISKPQFSYPLTLYISLPFRRSIEGHLNLILKSFFLTEARFWRSRKYEEPGDVMNCIKYLHYLRDQSLRALGVTRTGVTASIMHALALRVDLWPGNVTQGVEKMSVLISSITLLHPLLQQQMTSITARGV
jgi:hypothetical protein